jgi:hypothetical protein
MSGITSLSAFSEGGTPRGGVSDHTDKDAPTLRFIRRALIPALSTVTHVAICEQFESTRRTTTLPSPAK